MAGKKKEIFTGMADRGSEREVASSRDNLGTGKILGGEKRVSGGVGRKIVSLGGVTTSLKKGTSFFPASRCSKKKVKKAEGRRP